MLQTIAYKSEKRKTTNSFCELGLEVKSEKWSAYFFGEDVLFNMK